MVGFLALVANNWKLFSISYLINVDLDKWLSAHKKVLKWWLWYYLLTSIGWAFIVDKFAIFGTGLLIRLKKGEIFFGLKMENTCKTEFMWTFLRKEKRAKVTLAKALLTLITSGLILLNHWK